MIVGVKLQVIVAIELVAFVSPDGDCAQQVQGSEVSFSLSATPIVESFVRKSTTYGLRSICRLSLMYSILIPAHQYI